LHKPIRPERLLRTLLSILPSRHSGARRRRTDVVTPSEAPAMARLRVLVAEDQAVNAHLMALYLQQLGHDSDHVDNGEQAVEAVRTGNFDVVLMDAQMPVLGGVDATAAIRCLSGPQPHIIAVTASVLPADRAAFLAAGADEFLTKPVRLSTLRESLSRWTDGAGQADAPAEPVDVSDVGQVGAPSDAGGALDPETVEELRDLGAADFQHLYQQYVDGLQSTVEALFSAVDDTSWSEEDETSVPRLAHRLKGSSAAMGAQRMAGLCQRLVEIDPGSPDLEGALNALLAESRAVLSAVAALSAPGSAGPGRGGPPPTTRG
jgi:CheY-like chemotaxis protein